MNQQDINYTINQSYYDQDVGYQSVMKTLLLVKEIIPDIKFNQVKERFLTNVERKTRDVKGYNSYVPQRPYHQLQIDIYIYN